MESAENFKTEAGRPGPTTHATDPVSGGDTGFFVALSELVVDRNIQTRRDRDETVVASIRASMVARIAAGWHPQETPAWVVRRGTQWLLIAGFTRYELLSELAKEDTPFGRKPTIWVTVKEAPTIYRAVVENMRENLGRQNLSVADEAEGYARLRKLDPSKTIAEIASDTPRSVAAVENLIRGYEKTTPEIWGAFRRGEIPQRAVLKLAALHEDKEAQRKAFERLKNPEKRRADAQVADKERGAPSAESAERSVKLERLWSAFDALRIRWYMQAHDAKRTELGNALGLVVSYLEHHANLVSHPRPPTVDEIAAQAFLGAKPASTKGEPKSLYGAGNTQAMHYCGEGACPRAAEAKRWTTVRGKVTCAWCAQTMAEAAKVFKTSASAKVAKRAGKSKSRGPKASTRAAGATRAKRPSSKVAHNRMAEFWKRKKAE